MFNFSKNITDNVDMLDRVGILDIAVTLQCSVDDPNSRSNSSTLTEAEEAMLEVYVERAQLK